MIRCLLAVALLVAASCAPAWAGESVMKADPAYGVRYAEEKVVTLPEDQETPYLTLFGDRNDSKFRAMVKWFETNETLVGIRNQTHFNVIYSDQPIYRDRYAATVAALPCVRLQAIDEDQPVAEYSGAGVPMTDVFFLICSVEDRTHLRVLARLSRMLNMPGFLESLRSTADSASARQLIVEADGKLGSG